MVYMLAILTAFEGTTAICCKDFHLPSTYDMAIWLFWFRLFDRIRNTLCIVKHAEITVM